MLKVRKAKRHSSLAQAPLVHLACVGQPFLLPSFPSVLPMAMTHAALPPKPTPLLAFFLPTASQVPFLRPFFHTHATRTWPKSWAALSSV